MTNSTMLHTTSFMSRYSIASRVKTKWEGEEEDEEGVFAFVYTWGTVIFKSCA